MSTHPNVILMAVLTPDALSRLTMREILAEAEQKYEHSDDIVIGDEEYHPQIMESDYEEGYQIAASEGDLVFFRFVTYGYGEVVKWDELEAEKTIVEEWAKKVCAKHHCSYSIQVTANYW